MATVRLDEALHKHVVEYAKEKKMPENIAFKELVNEGLLKWKLEKAIDLYGKGHATAWRAAELAGIPLSKMIVILAERKIPIHYDLKDLEEDIRR
jgi:predicted HTH domain antitoxin